jgi:hypothetical protein
LAIVAGLAKYKAASQSFWQSYEMQTVGMTGCINYLTNLAWYLGVGPKELAEEVQTLKKQSKDGLRVIAEEQQTRVEQEWFKELEAKNREIERTLASMEEMLQQHTSWWATAQAMLEKLECLALPSVFVRGQAFLRGLQNQQTPEMADVLLHMLSNLPEEIGHKISNIRILVTEVKDSFGMVVPAYHWDEGRKTFERILKAEEVASGRCMSQVPWYELATNPKQPIMPQLPQLQDWTELEQNGIMHNSFGPDLNRPQE